MEELKQTTLNVFHTCNRARMVPFAGYSMPVQYEKGIISEHLYTRRNASIFDVGHMGQIQVRSRGGMAEAATALESVMPSDIVGLADGRQRYAILTNEEGGIIDDLMVANKGDHFLLVVNASRKMADLQYLKERIGSACYVELVRDRDLIALQGPASEERLGCLVPEVRRMRFLDVMDCGWSRQQIWISRSGYTGEDGFEISMPSNLAIELVKALMKHETVELAGLAARDSLRLEAGMCLYGNDIDESTSPVEAGLLWSIPMVRRKTGARAGGFPGAQRIFQEMEEGPARRRIGIRPGGRIPMRQGTQLFADPEGKLLIGKVTSGGFGATMNAPISMGYVQSDCAEPDLPVFGLVRGKYMPARIAALPFVRANYKR